MSSVLSSFIPAPRSRARRLLADLPLAVAVGALLAVVITVVVGRPDVFFENLIVSVLIGVAAYVLINGGRLLFLDYPDWGPRGWACFLALVFMVAPLAHPLGLHVASLILGFPTPTLDSYFTVRRASMVLFTLIGTGLMTLLVMNREHLRRTREEHAAQRLRAEVVERQALQAQLRLMQAQIEPHMLFNTLANLQGLIAIDPARAGTMLDGLIQYLRATLNASRSENTTLEHEFAAMQAYLGLMGVRMGERLAYRLALPPGLRSARLPSMLLQPLVENAIVHGLEPKIDGGEIVIDAASEQGALVITVCDTGLGLGHTDGQCGGGVGVSTTRERLAALYGAGASLTLTPAQPCGTLARLTLPLETP